MQGRKCVGLVFLGAALAGCHVERPPAPPEPVASTEPAVEGIPVGDQRSAMEAAADRAPATTVSSAAPTPSPAGGSGPALAPNAPDSYVVKRGDTLWGIAKVFLRDPWYWPEIWQVNPQIRNPHLIYPGDTLRLVYVDGKPRIVVQRSTERGGEVRVEPRVRSEPLGGAITTIPYETVAAFMSKPVVLSKEQLKTAPYVLTTRDLHVVMAEGDTVYARGFKQPTEVGVRYALVRVGDPLVDPDDDQVLGYNGVYTGSGRVVRVGDPVTLVMNDSTRETYPGDKLIPASEDVQLNFMPSPPKVRTDGSIILVSDGVSVIGQYQVVAINRGSRDGLAPGNVLAILSGGNVVRDTASKGYLQGVSHFGGAKVTLPEERSGTFMVFKTFDRLSYGLVMEATDIIQVGDRVANP